MTISISPTSVILVLIFVSLFFDSNLIILKTFIVLDLLHFLDIYNVLISLILNSISSRVMSKQFGNDLSKKASLRINISNYCHSNIRLYYKKSLLVEIDLDLTISNVGHFIKYYSQKLLKLNCESFNNIYNTVYINHISIKLSNGSYDEFLQDIKDVHAFKKMQKKSKATRSKQSNEISSGFVIPSFLLKLSVIHNDVQVNFFDKHKFTLDKLTLLISPPSTAFLRTRSLTVLLNKLNFNDKIVLMEDLKLNITEKEELSIIFNYLKVPLDPLNQFKSDLASCFQSSTKNEEQNIDENDNSTHKEDPDVDVNLLIHNFKQKLDRSSFKLTDIQVVHLEITKEISSSFFAQTKSFKTGIDNDRKVVIMTVNNLILLFKKSLFDINLQNDNVVDTSNLNIVFEQLFQLSSFSIKLSSIKPVDPNSDVKPHSLTLIELYLPILSLDIIYNTYMNLNTATSVGKAKEKILFDFSIVNPLIQIHHKFLLLVREIIINKNKQNFIGSQRKPENDVQKTHSNTTKIIGLVFNNLKSIIDLKMSVSKILLTFVSDIPLSRDDNVFSSRNNGLRSYRSLTGKINKINYELNHMRSSFTLLDFKIKHNYHNPIFHINEINVCKHDHATDIRDSVNDNILHVKDFIVNLCDVDLILFFYGLYLDFTTLPVEEFPEKRSYSQDKNEIYKDNKRPKEKRNFLSMLSSVYISNFKFSIGCNKILPNIIRNDNAIPGNNNEAYDLSDILRGFQLAIHEINFSRRSSASDAQIFDSAKLKGIEINRINGILKKLDTSFPEFNLKRLIFIDHMHYSNGSHKLSKSIHNEKLMRKNMQIGKIVSELDISVVWLLFVMKYFALYLKTKSTQSRPEFFSISKRKNAYSKKKDVNNNNNNLLLDIAYISITFKLPPNDTTLVFVFNKISVDFKKQFIDDPIAPTNLVGGNLQPSITDKIPWFVISNTRIYATNNTVISQAMNHYDHRSSVKSPTFFCALNIDDFRRNHGINLKFSCHRLQLYLPFKFLFYKITDSLSLTVKAIKQMKANFKVMNHNLIHPDKTQEVFKNKIPTQEDAKHIISTIINVDEFKIDIKDNDFESELSLIYKIGLIEQKQRLEKLRLFNERDEDFDEALLEEEVNAVLNHKSNSSLAEKKLVLYKHFSKSWIRLFQVSKKYRDGLNEQNMPALENLPNLKIEEIYNLPSLVKLISRGISFSFSDFDSLISEDSGATVDLSDFLYTVGKNIPKDTKFNLLIPLHMKIQSTNGLKVLLRDYPLPIIYFPDFLTIEGGIVFAEELTLNPTTRRNIPISFCGNSKVLDLLEDDQYDYFKTKTNPFYASLISRSLNPVKTYLDLKIVNNNSYDHDSMLVWGKSLQPAISTAMQCFDNLSKPPIDQSPRIGWWDKFRLIIHGRFQILWKSKMNLIIKGSRDPYQIIEDGSGFNFCFNNNAKLLVNYTFKSDELLVLKCDTFVFGIPQFKKRIIEESDSSLGDTVVEVYEMVTNDFKKVITTLTGNIVWKAGMLFEREIVDDIIKIPGNQERTFKFKPHYLVERANPLMVKSSHDSYKGFRSDYIHLAIGVENLNNIKNNFHLTPFSIMYFRRWWALFNNSLSLPLRQGKIFSSELDKKKFGASLYTIKYKINLESLFISHFLRYTNDTLSHPNEIHFAGLKMKSRTFALDLHQRKQKVMYTNETLRLCKHIWHLTFNDGKIDCEDNEIKFINTIFNEISTEDLLIKSLGIFDNASSNGSSDNSSNDSSASNLASPIKSPTSVLSDDYWIDFNDYIELEFDKPKSRNPKFKIMSFFKTPRCTYIRQNDQNIVQQANPFGDEPSHLCHNFKSQEFSLIEFIKLRSIEIEDKIKKCKAKIQEINNKDALEGSDTDISDYRGKLKDFKYGLHTLKSIINEQEELLKYASAEEPNFGFSSTDSLSEVNSVNGQSLDIADDGLYDIQRIRTGVSSHLSFSEIEASKFKEAHSKFNNRFIINNLLLKWNNSLRNNILKFVSQSKDFQSIEYFLGRKLIKYLQNLQKNMKDEKDKCSPPESDDDLQLDFTEIDENLHEIEYHYLLKLVCPQIQFQSVEESPNSICLLLAQDIELQSVNILTKGFLNTYKDDKISHKLESRSQLHLKEMQTFIVNKEDTTSDGGLRFHQNSFGGQHNWPTWIHIEGFYDSKFLSKCQFSMKTNSSLKFNRVNNLFINYNADIYDENGNISKQSANDDIKKDLLKLDIPKFEIFCTSNQFDIVYTLVTNLIVFEELKNSKTFKRLKGLVLASNLDLNTIDVSVNELQQKIQKLVTIKHQLQLKEGNRNDDLMLVSMDISKFLLKMLISVRAIQSESNVNKINEFIWNLQSSEIKLHLLNDDYSHLIDLTLEDSRYTRINHLDNSATNIINIGSMKAVNLRENALYPELLDSLDADKLSKISWKNNPKVGGIAVMEFLLVDLEPLKFQIDNETAKIIFNFVFPNLSKKSVKNGSTPSQTHNTFKDGDNQYTLMAERSAKYINFNKVQIKKTELWLSYKGHSKISDIENLVIKIPLLEYYNHICSFKDLALLMKKDILKVLIHHTGDIISNKFKKNHKHQLQYHKNLSNSSITKANTASNALSNVSTRVSELTPKSSATSSKKHSGSFDLPRTFRGLSKVLTSNSRLSNHSTQPVVISPNIKTIDYKEEDSNETLDDIDQSDPNIIPFTQNDI